MLKKYEIIDIYLVDFIKKCKDYRVEIKLEIYIMRNFFYVGLVFFFCSCMIFYY